MKCSGGPCSPASGGATSPVSSELLSERQRLPDHAEEECEISRTASQPPPYPSGGVEAPTVDHAIAADGTVTETGMPHALKVTVLVIGPPVVATVDEYTSGACEWVSMSRADADSGSSTVAVPKI